MYTRPEAGSYVHECLPSLPSSESGLVLAGADEELLAAAWESGRVSLRLMAFHVAFLDLVAKPRGVTLEQVRPYLTLLQP